MMKGKCVAARAIFLAVGVGLLPWAGSLRAEARSPVQVQPSAEGHADSLADLESVPVSEAPPVDRQAVALEDEQREAAGLAPRFAIANPVSVTPQTDGVWEKIGDDVLVWRLRVSSPGAESLNLGFTRYHMPEGGRLFIYSSDLARVLRPFTHVDNAQHGELWTPILPTDDIVVEVTIPASVRDELELELASINVGYRGFSKVGADKSGLCNIDVVCPEGDSWWDEIPSVAVISTGGSLFCTGFMVNNTSEDQTPYFQTAYHCGIRSYNAASLVTYWNYETSSCGGTPNGSLSDWQSGSYFRAEYSTSDFTLVEMDSAPNPDWGVTFAGWDRSGADASMAVGIHHPSCDEKRISFEYDSTTTTSYLGTSVPGDGTHVRLIDWDLGTTEGGSSGSPLFNQNHHAIGQLHGGYAACGNDSSDWYGKFSVSWTGGGTSSSRLSTWLDPGSTGVTSLDTLVPGQGYCGDGTCDSGEDKCNCPQDCGTPPPNEVPGSTCTDGLDNDCDTFTDCDDSDCDSDPACICDNDGTCESGEDCNNCPNDCISGSGGAVCGNGLCEAGDGEDCRSCSADCNGKTTGAPSGRFCCGATEGCGDSRCNEGDWSCTTEPQGTPYCCGDGFCTGIEDSYNCEIDCGSPPYCGDGNCDPDEDQCNCPEDCGTPPTTETSCTDGIDNDCDTDTDCDDSDCEGDPACACLPRGASCTLDSECCSNRCHKGYCK